MTHPYTHLDSQPQAAEKRAPVPADAFGLDDRLYATGSADAATAPGLPGEDDPKQRLYRLFGPEALGRLAASRVAVFGLGGVGSWCMEALARGGVGALVLVDGDQVALSNINRQAIAFRDTVGQRKVAAAAQLVRRIDPALQLQLYGRFVLSEDVPALLDEIGPVDYVADCIDSIATKLALAQAAQDRGFALISSAGGANKVCPELVQVADITRTVNDPICRILRKECRKRGIRRLQMVYTPEQPVPVPMAPGATRKERTNLGTSSFVPPIMGMTMAGAIIRQLTGIDS